MVSEKRYKAARIALKTPSDARRLIRRVLAEIYASGVSVENAGKIANLLTVWAKLWETSEILELQERIRRLELDKMGETQDEPRTKKT